MRKLTTEEFITRSHIIHNNKYDYSKVNYENCQTKICIICHEHGEFWQLPSAHLAGQGCPHCKINKRKLSQENFINKANKIFSNKYIYNKVNYINNKTKIIVECPHHGEFKVTPNNHLRGSGCPLCNNHSKGEDSIRKYLIEKSIKFEEQKRFEDCKNKYPLPFDFYLPDYNLCIEYQGEQHYEPIKHFGGDMGLEYRVLTNNIKKKFCYDNHINFLEISYKDKNDIKSILDNSIFSTIKYRDPLILS